MTNKTDRNGRTKSESLAATKQRFGAVENVPTASLKSYARNPRRHPERQIAQLMASIRAFGFVMPILIDGNSTIIAGHGRVEAARRLGLAEVPVLAASGWTEAQIRAYRVADNRLAELGEWDEAKLTIELSVLVEIDELPIEAFGWQAEEIGLVIGGSVAPVQKAKSAQKAPKAPKAERIPASRIGDVWILGCFQLHLSRREIESRRDRVPPTDIFGGCVDSALRSWASAIGMQPVLAATGERFDEVEARRAREGTSGDGRGRTVKQR